MIDSGNTAWLLTATALVLFMTLPGLALFYGGNNINKAQYIGILIKTTPKTNLVMILNLSYINSIYKNLFINK
jgi:Amt family ammonium transporter